MKLWKWIVAIVVVCGIVAAADAKSQSGKVGKKAAAVVRGKIVAVDASGKSGTITVAKTPAKAKGKAKGAKKEVTLNVGPNAKVLVNGKASTLAKLKTNESVVVKATGKNVSTIKATGLKKSAGSHKSSKGKSAGSKAAKRK